MNGHVSKRAGYWRIVLELGDQVAQRCPACVRVDAKGRERSALHWTDGGRLESCPACGGELEDVTTRRQEMLPEKYTRKTDAERAMHETIRDRERGDYVPPVDLSLRDYLVDSWQPTLPALELAPSTVEAYKLHVKRIVRVLGTVPLQKLSRNDVARLSGELAETTSRQTGKPLAAQTRRSVLVVLHRALGDAVAAGLIRTNPAQGVRAPKVRRGAMHTWTKEELAGFLQATRQDRMGPLWHVLALTGLRRGECLGLYWEDVDLEAGRLFIQRQRVCVGYEVEERPPKTGKGRPVSIDAGTVAALRRQSAQQLADAGDWGDAWQATGHVFTREDGAPWHPDRAKKLYEDAVKASGLPRIRMHDLRHTWATLALRAGVHPKVVQERLGHSSIGITMDTYSHVLPDLQEGAAELVAALITGAEKGAEGRP